MECPNAYLKKDIGYVLCRKEPEPTRYDREKLFHAVCAHQVDCPKQKCYKLSASWSKCSKLAKAPETPHEDVYHNAIEEPNEEAKPARKSRRKTKTEE